MNKLPLEKRIKIIQLLVEGNSLRSCSRITDVSINTVTKLLIDTGMACLKFHNKTVIGLDVRRVQCDEIWSFVYSKAKNTPDDAQDIGDVWTWVAQDADSRFVISWLVGKRDMAAAKIFMKDVAGRIKNRIQLTTDGFKAYLEAVDDAFHLKIDYCVLEKIYGIPSSPHPVTGKLSKKEQYIGARKLVRSGDPKMKFVSTSYIERQNLTMRMCIRRFARKTNAFSKKMDNHCLSIALHYFYYNFVRVHKTLRVTPAMQVGLTKKPMTIEDMVKMI